VQRRRELAGLDVGRADDRAFDLIDDAGRSAAGGERQRCTAEERAATARALIVARAGDRAVVDAALRVDVALACLGIRNRSAERALAARSARRAEGDRVRHLRVA